MAAPFIIKRNDTEPAFRVRLDLDGTAVNLTGATCKFIMSDLRGNVKVDSAAVIDADQVTNTGYVDYEWVAADTDTAGRYRAEWEVTYGSGNVQTFPTNGYDIVIVRGDLA